MHAMLGLEKHLRQSWISRPPLLDLVYLRASQINGCAYCIDMHWKDLRAGGESEQRLYGLDAWAESSITPTASAPPSRGQRRSRALADGHVPDAVFETVRTRSSPRQSSPTSRSASSRSTGGID